MKKHSSKTNCEELLQRSIFTVNVVLKPTIASDYNDYYNIRSSPADIYWNGYESAPDQEQFRDVFIKRLGNTPLENTEDRRLYLIQLEDKTYVGFVQLIKRQDGIDISYTVTEEYQGKGYATEALKLAISIAMKFTESVYVQIRDDNIASQCVAKKCGFIRTDEYSVHDYPKAGKVALRKYRLPTEDKMRPLNMMRAR